MVRVAENNLTPEIVELLGLQALEGALRADRHEDGSVDRLRHNAMRHNTPCDEMGHNDSITSQTMHVCACVCVCVCVTGRDGERPGAAE
jgi:hypothetical protein